MDALQPRQISVLEPVGAAIEKTKEILFRPFDLGKWFTLGFCAWLAMLGENGGGFGNFNFPGRPHDGSSANFRHELNNLKEGVLNNLPIVLMVGITVIVLILVLAFVFIWLKSRGQFMFLHGVARNVAEVANPWNRYARSANSLFLFNIMLWLMSSVLGLILMAPLVFIFFMCVKTDFEVLTAMGVIGAVFLILGLICLGVVFAVVKILTKDFVVPIMYLQGCTVTEGWKRFWNLCKLHKSNFVLFVLFLFVVGIVIGLLILLVMLMTCCCAACIFAIPYIGTVALLPVLVWRRAYSALFLAQLGPEFDVFAQAGPAVVPIE
ncbi:MAG: hypothetical protein L0Y36_06300 [Planctomycetales bacterium]|nr:hypothetical protein [Planctomycetales bacterium]